MLYVHLICLFIAILGTPRILRAKWETLAPDHIFVWSVFVFGAISTFWY